MYLSKTKQSKNNNKIWKLSRILLDILIQFWLPTILTQRFYMIYLRMLELNFSVQLIGNHLKSKRNLLSQFCKTIFKPRNSNNKLGQKRKPRMSSELTRNFLLTYRKIWDRRFYKIRGFWIAILVATTSQLINHIDKLKRWTWHHF